VTAGFTDSWDRRVVLDTRQVPQRGDSLRQIRLGQTELQVSRIAFGTWAYGGDWGAADVDHAKASIHRALELGINLFDTAQGYGFGAAERLLGEALWERARREDVAIATKGGQILPWCARHDVGVLVYGPLAHGLLSGRMRRSMAFDPDDWRSKSPDFTGETFRRNLAVVARLKGCAGQRASACRSWRRPGRWPTRRCTSRSWARRPSQLEGTAQAADVQLSDTDLQQIDDILVNAVSVRGPHPEGM
jgi:aryl-alcohol dehydrogenase-like predicted oxidoreductase